MEESEYLNRTTNKICKNNITSLISFAIQKPNLCTLVKCTKNNNAYSLCRHLSHFTPLSASILYR